MQNELRWLTEHDPRTAYSTRATLAMHDGRQKDARAFATKSTDIDVAAGLTERAALGWALQGVWDSLYGAKDDARVDALLAVKLAPASSDVAWQAAALLAFSGFAAEAQPLLKRTLTEFPATHTLRRNVYVPTIRGAMLIAQGQAAAAAEMLRPSMGFVSRGGATAYLHAMANLAAGQSREAAAEFQTVIDQSHIPINYVLGPLARLGLARALAKADDLEKSRRGLSRTA